MTKPKRPDIVRRLIKVARNKRTPEGTALLLLEAGREIERLWFCQELLEGTTKVLSFVLDDMPRKSSKTKPE